MKKGLFRKGLVFGIIVMTLLIGTMIFPVNGQTAVSKNIIKNNDEISSEYLISENSNYPLNNDLDEYIINFMSEDHIPGLSATIVKNDSVFWTNSYGYANISKGQLVEDTTLFLLASVSKTIVATAIMQLYEQGYFDLHDPINDYLQFEVNHPNFPSTNITFLMLLTHTSSIKDNWGVMHYFPGDPTMPLGEYLEEYLTPGGNYYNPALNFCPEEPGTVFEYSNIGAALIGYLVEVISNVTFAEYCEINIFQPLDMDETAWFLADLNVSNIAVPYRWIGSKYIAYPHYSNNWYPAACLRSSVTELRNHLMMMMNNGKYNSTQILQESTVDLMLSTQYPSLPIQGIIWYKMYFGGRNFWGHSGSYDGCRTVMLFEPKTNIGVIVLTNGEFGNQAMIEILIELFDFAENMPPNEPIIDGPASGKTRIKYDYIFVTSDPEEHNVSYFIDWGDNTTSDWSDFVTSGAEITLTHKWSKQGSYTIKAKAKDSYDAESDWSEFEVTIPRTRVLTNVWYQCFLECFPMLERLLNFL